MIQPVTIKGRLYFATFLSFVRNPTAKIKTSGNIKMRWYQQRSQGGSFIKKEKKKLPAAEATEINQLKYKKRSLGIESHCI